MFGVCGAAVRTMAGRISSSFHRGSGLFPVRRWVSWLSSVKELWKLFKYSGPDVLTGSDISQNAVWHTYI